MKYRRKFHTRRVRASVVLAVLAAVLYALVLDARDSPADAAYGYGAGVDPSLASWYGPGLWGNVTYGGDVLDRNDWTAAHPYLPMGQKITVCYERCARGVTITDRGPAEWTGRGLDVTKPVARKIGLTYVGVDNVTWWETGYDPYYLQNVS